MEDPTPVGLYLGCQRRRFDVNMPQGPLGVMIYDVEAFFEHCTAKYLSCQGAKPLVTAHTPFVPRTEAIGVARAAVPDGWDPDWRGGEGMGQVKGGPRALPKATADELVPVQASTPEEPPGTLSPYAASVVMKVMYGARVARPDFLRAIQGQAAVLKTWNLFNDDDLHRMMS